jgi:predicted ATPase/DNA-binding NarL/FixJ family response regulator
MSISSLEITDGVSTNLPIQPTPFIGRELEVDAACGLLQRVGVRLVTLTGPGGAGKTRLSVQVGAKLLSDYHDGVFFVALAPISDPDLVPATIAQTLGVTESGSKPILHSLKSYLQSKHTLLVLDNFEQVLDAAPMVADILASAPGLKMLITSRSRLRLRGEHELPVPPLSLPDTKHLPPVESLADYESVRLFVERAAALRPDFTVNSDNASAIAEICSRLDGLPLAIELAAARIKILSPQAMLSRLDSRLKLLTSGGKDLPERQQTLRNAIEWSYDLLSEDEKTLFRRLSVFAGGRTLEAIEAVCEFSILDLRFSSGTDNNLKSKIENLKSLDVLDGVESLVDKNLLRQVDGPGGETRFVMLETIQEYAWERLEQSGEAGPIQAQHAGYFLMLAEKAEPELRGPRQGEWLERLDAEHDNLRTALKWSIEHEEGEIALALCGALMQFWKMHGHAGEGRGWIESALAKSKGTATPARAKALRAAGVLASAQGDYLQAKSALEESLGLFRQLSDKPNMALTLRSLGNEERQQGDYEASYAHLEEGLALARELGDRLDIAVFLGDIGIVAQTLNDQESARAFYEESLAARRELRDKRGIAMMLVNLGELMRAQGNYDAAHTMYEEALDITRDLGDKWGSGMVLHNLGHVADHRRQYDEAYDLFAESLRLFYELRNKRDIAYCLSALAGVFGSRRQPERAAMLFAAAHDLSSTISSHLDPADLIEYERNLAGAKAQLNPPAWERAWRRGQNMTLDEAVAYALERGPAVVDSPRAVTGPLGLPHTTSPLRNILTTAPLGDYPEELSEREAEVLRLVATGMTDGQVADALAISPRTVNRHLSSIYSKLGVTTRTAAARVAAEYHLI